MILKKKVLFAQLTFFLTGRLNEQPSSQSLGISGDGRNNKSDLTRLKKKKPAINLNIV